MVCCHWKNKGWCRYQDTCKFQHPPHKQGAGLAADAASALAQQHAQQRRHAPGAAPQVSTSPEAWGVGPAAVLTGFGPPPAPPPAYPPMLARPAVAAVPAR